MQKEEKSVFKCYEFIKNNFPFLNVKNNFIFHNLFHKYITEYFYKIQGWMELDKQKYNWFGSHLFQTKLGSLALIKI